MKTILRALLDEIHYPIGEGHAENRLIKRGLNGSLECSKEIMDSTAFMGAVADSLIYLLGSVNFTEADKQISMTDKSNILKHANSIYRSIGEPEVSDNSQPEVCFGNSAWQ